MSRTRLLVVSARLVGAVVAVVAIVAVTLPAYATTTRLYAFRDSRIDEASGIAAGITSPGIDYVQNDSGDSARFFAIAPTGATAAVVTLPDATNVDWEDIDCGPDAAGTNSVWLADIGDNAGNRSEVDVYRVDEPSIATSDRKRRIVAGPSDEWRLRYPSGPINAESFATSPTGTGYLVTKSERGDSTMYRVPPRPSRSTVQTLQRVGPINFAALAPVGSGVASLLATGAAISRNGKLLLVRTYTDAYLWHITTSMSAALRTRPTRIALPLQPQGEGIGFADASGSSLLIDSEGVNTAVYQVTLPAGSVPGSATASTPPTAEPSGTPGRSPGGVSATTAAKSVHDGSGAPDDEFAWVAVLAAAALTVAGGLLLARRIGRRARQ